MSKLRRRLRHRGERQQEEPMKYLILIYGNAESRAIWESFTDEQQAEGYEYYRGIAEELAASGELIVTEALADASETKRVTATEGGAVATDGPFAEAKELLAGFFLVECESAARAIDIAGRLPEAQFGLIEVRPVMDLGGMEM
jgi:hypothetical protein